VKQIDLHQYLFNIYLSKEYCPVDQFAKVEILSVLKNDNLS